MGRGLCGAGRNEKISDAENGLGRGRADHLCGTRNPMGTAEWFGWKNKISSLRHYAPERGLGIRKVPRAIPRSFGQGVEKVLVASVIRFVCHDCGGPVTEAKLFRTLPRVTSDCRPWPAGGRMGSCRSCGLVQTWASPQWRKECIRIYSTYRIYRQSGGKEQAVFGGGAGEPRSVRLVRGLRSVHRLSARGSVLDVGCGNGGFLRAFHEMYPQWGLYGTEFDRRNEQVLQRIPGFVRLYCGSKNPPNGHFDLISLVHVLEHLEHPAHFLAGLLKLARPRAKILIEVPDAKANPFILPVADHISHFDRRSLRTVAEKAGLRVQVLRSDLVPRELTLIATVNPKNSPRRAKPPMAPGWLKPNLQELHGFARKATREARNEPLTVFGSSLGAAWIYGVVKGRVSTFLDEDTARHGGMFLGRRIQGLMKSGKKVLIPLAKKIRKRIAIKLSQLEQDGKKNSP